jgi:hypothetical protein
MTQVELAADRIDMLRVIASHEHYVPLNLPLATLTLNEVTNL